MSKYRVAAETLYKFFADGKPGQMPVVYLHQDDGGRGDSARLVVVERDWLDDLWAESHGDEMIPHSHFVPADEEEHDAEEAGVTHF